MVKCFNCEATTSLHRIPRLLEIVKKFFPNVDTSPESVRSFRICSAHFESKFKTVNGRLVRNAVPTKFLNEEGIWYNVETCLKKFPIVYPEEMNENSFETDIDYDAIQSYEKDNYQQISISPKSEDLSDDILTERHDLPRANYGKLKTKINITPTKDDIQLESNSYLTEPTFIDANAEHYFKKQSETITNESKEDPIINNNNIVSISQKLEDITENVSVTKNFRYSGDINLQENYSRSTLFKALKVCKLEIEKHRKESKILHQKNRRLKNIIADLKVKSFKLKTKTNVTTKKDDIRLESKTHLTKPTFIDTNDESYLKQHSEIIKNGSEQVEVLDTVIQDEEEYLNVEFLLETDSKPKTDNSNLCLFTKNEINNSKPEVLKEKHLFKCKKCEKIIKTRLGYKKHLIGHQQCSLICSVCGIKTKNQESKILYQQNRRLKTLISDLKAKTFKLKPKTNVTTKKDNIQVESESHLIKPTFVDTNDESYLKQHSEIKTNESEKFQILGDTVIQEDEEYLNVEYLLETDSKPEIDKSNLEMNNCEPDFSKEKNVFKCKKCEQIIKTKSKYKKHLIGHQECSLICSVCGIKAKIQESKILYQKNRRLKNLIADLKAKSFKVKTKTNVTRKKDNIQVESESHLTKPTFVDTNDESYLKQHSEIKTNESEQVEVLDDTIIEEDEDYLNVEYLLETDSKPKSDNSNLCLFTTNEVIDSEPEFVEEKNGFKCIKCEKMIKTQSGCRKHLLSHNEYSIICFICGYKAKNNKTLYNHEKKHETYFWPRDCPYCVKSFTDRLKRYDHINSHQKIKPYICSCGKKTSFYGNFMVHIKKNKCPIEGRKIPDYAPRSALLLKDCIKFKINGELKMKNIYENVFSELGDENNIQFSDYVKFYKRFGMEKKFVCVICDKKYGKESYLKYHINESHIESYKCDKCVKYFKKRDYRNHLKMHLNDNNNITFSCSSEIQGMDTKKKLQNKLC